MSRIVAAVIALTVATAAAVPSYAFDGKTFRQQLTLQQK